MSVLRLVKLSAVAAVYVVFTVLTPLSYGEIQFRFSEILILLCFFRKDYAYSIIIGCFISNLFSPLVLFDMFFGTFQTVVATFLITRSKNMFFSSLYPVITMPIIAYELTLAYKLPFLLTCLTTMAGEFVVVVLIGYPLFLVLRKQPRVLELIDANRNVEVI
jgi:uncharacterized membrane protein